MFTIDSEARIMVYLGEAVPEDDGTYIHTRTELAALISAKPGEWSVQLWNHLPGVTPILTPKFRNKQTAVERIWAKLAELYPDAILESDMPKKRGHAVPTQRPAERVRRVGADVRGRGQATTSGRNSGSGEHTNGKNGGKNGTRKSAWAEELTEALRKRFRPGDSFELQDVYKWIPQFQRRHQENHHIAARLRTTLAQDLRGTGIVKSVSKGKYRMA